MTAASFTDILWLPCPQQNSFALSEEFISKSLEMTSSLSSSSSSSAGDLWRQWLKLLKCELLPSLPEDNSTNNNSLVPTELIAESGNKNVMVQKCSSSSSSLSSSFVAKYVGYAFWKRLIAHKKQHAEIKISRNQSSLIGKDSLNIEQNFIREALNNLWLLSSSSGKNSNNSNFCRLLGVGFVSFGGNNTNNHQKKGKRTTDAASSSSPPIYVDSSSDEEENIDSSSSNLLAPCLIFEQLECNLSEFTKLLFLRCSTKKEEETTRRRILNDMIKKKLVKDIHENCLKKLLSQQRLSQKLSDDTCHYYLSAHLDICPSNILIRRNKSRRARSDEKEENNSTTTNNNSESSSNTEDLFDFVLADWDCAVWSTKRKKASLCDNNNEKNIQVDHLVETIVKKYGTPPYANEKLIVVQDEVISKNHHGSDEDEEGDDEGQQENIGDDYRDCIFQDIIDDGASKKHFYYLRSDFVRACDEYSFNAVLSELNDDNNNSGGARLMNSNHSHGEGFDESVDASVIFSNMHQPVAASESLNELLEMIVASQV